MRFFPAIQVHRKRLDQHGVWDRKYRAVIGPPQSS